MPVYWGTADALRAFNPKSFIHCGEFTDLEACADRVAEVCIYVLIRCNIQIKVVRMSLLMFVDI